VRSKVKTVSANLTLERVLDALAQEAIEASDEEIAEVATDLRMDLNSRESAAFAGLTYFSRPQLADFFDIELPKSLEAPERRIARDGPAKPTGHAKRPQFPGARKSPKEK